MKLWILVGVTAAALAALVSTDGRAWCQGAYCGPQRYSGYEHPYRSWGGGGRWIAEQYNRCFNCQGPPRPAYMPRNDRYIGRGALWGYPGWRGY